MRPTPGRRIRVSPTGGARHWWNDEEKELFYQGSDGMVYVVRVEHAEGTLHFGQPEALFDLKRSLEPTPVFHITGAGQPFLVCERGDETESPPVHLILNWTSLVESRNGE